MTRTRLSFIDALQASLPENKTALQCSAWKRFDEMGLPTRKTEAFRELPLHHLYSQDFLKGVEQNITEQPEGVIAQPFSQAQKSYGTLLRNNLNRATLKEQDPFLLLTTALCPDGLFLYVPPNTCLEEPIELKRRGGEIQMPHTFLYVGAGSRVSIVLQREASSFFNGLTDIVVGEGAEVEVTQNGLDIPSDSCYFDALRVSLKKDCTFSNSVITRGSKLMRHFIAADLLGEGAKASVNGVSLLSDNRESHQRVLINHAVPGCISRQCTKNVLSGKSRSSVGGCVFVDSSAQNTDAHQLNQNLLLSDAAQAIAKPHMEILADDVKASHGATFGQLSDEQLFYFKTRGVSDKMAKSLLILGFCKEVIDAIPSRELKNQAATVALTFEEE